MLTASNLCDNVHCSVRARSVIREIGRLYLVALVILWTSVGRKMFVPVKFFSFLTSACNCSSSRSAIKNLFHESAINIILLKYWLTGNVYGKCINKVHSVTTKAYVMHRIKSTLIYKLVWKIQVEKCNSRRKIFCLSPKIHWIVDMGGG